MTPELALALHLILLHSIDGHEITIASQQVTSLRAHQPGKPNKLMTDDANCLIGLTDGRFVTVIESCAEVRELLKGE